MDADVIVVGGGLAGLVATAELTAAGKRVILVEQEPEASFGGQAFWSLGGLFMVDTPEQRRLRIKDSRELAWQDWLGAAGARCPRARPPPPRPRAIAPIRSAARCAPSRRSPARSSSSPASAWSRPSSQLTS